MGDVVSGRPGGGDLLLRRLRVVRRASGNALVLALAAASGALSVAVQPAGAAGPLSVAPVADSAPARPVGTAAFDRSFGKGGRLVVAPASDVRDVAVQPDGRIVALVDPTVARRTPDGS